MGAENKDSSHTREVTTKLSAKEHISITEEFSAHNYHPLHVVLQEGSGAWVTDVNGKKYLDFLSAYSAVNWGHSPKRFIDVAKKQLDILPMTSRAFFNDQLGLFCKELAEFCGLEVVLPMTTGAEAVETSIKASRRWGYQVKNVEKDKAEIICFSRNFAGRTTTIISFSDSETSKRDFGPFTPGFKVVPYGDIEAVKKAISPNTVGIIIEPIQGEGGVNVPPSGFLRQLRDVCTNENILFIADEVQTGFCRTGKRFAVDHEGVTPDLMIVGKSLGAGIVPISAVIGRKAVLGLFDPGSHGSTFGGYTLGCAIARDVLKYIKDEKPEMRARDLGDWFQVELKKAQCEKVKEIRGLGLLIGIEIKSSFGEAYVFCEKLAEEGVLTKDTRSSTMRVAPPLTISKEDLEIGLKKIIAVLK